MWTPCLIVGEGRNHSDDVSLPGAPLGFATFWVEQELETFTTTFNHNKPTPPTMLRQPRYKLYNNFFRAPSMRCFRIVINLLYSATTLFRRSKVVDLLLPIRFSKVIAALMSANIDIGLGATRSAVMYPSSEVGWGLKNQRVIILEVVRTNPK